MTKFKFYVKEHNTIYNVISMDFAGSGEPTSVLLDCPIAQKFYYVTEGELLRFTGHYDDDDVEMYENDVIVAERYPFFCEQDLNYLGVIEWAYGGWHYDMVPISEKIRGIACGDILQDPTGFKVIGNALTNPELLERK